MMTLRRKGVLRSGTEGAGRESANLVNLVGPMLLWFGTTVAEEARAARRAPAVMWEAPALLVATKVGVSAGGRGRG